MRVESNGEIGEGWEREGKGIFFTGRGKRVFLIKKSGDKIIELMK